MCPVSGDIMVVMKIRSALLACSMILILGPSYVSAATIPCAIRWDAFDTGTTNTIDKSVSRTLSPPQFWYRAPWYAVPEGPNSLLINGDSQSTMDQEITYAHKAGLTCWVYLWYGATDPMQNAWNLQQTSSIKNEVNWAQMESFENFYGASSVTAATPAIISYFQQSNYQTVLGGRPLWFLYDDGSYSTYVHDFWGGSSASVASAISTFRSSVEAAGLQDPYIVMVNGNAAIAAAVGADAVSNYIPNFGTAAIANPWFNVDSSIEAYWASLGSSAAANGIQTVPIAATGWDTRPRKENIVDWEAVGGKPYAGLDVYDVLPTPSQFTSELQDAVTYVDSNPTLVPSQVILIYAWDECDEGGNCLIPHYNPSSPSTPDISTLNAFSAVNW